MSDIQYHTPSHIGPDGTRIAFRLTPSATEGKGPTLVFLPGYMSDMSGGKATALFDAAKAEGRACLLLDYSGCGESDGDFADGTLSKWCDEVLALIEAKTQGPILLVGSSMGGWLMLLVGIALGKRLAGMIGIAAAPDFTCWGFDEAQRMVMASGDILYEHNPYGPEPTPTHPGFFADGEANLQLESDIAITCPVHLLHGQRDDDVPWEVSLKLAKALRSDDVQVTLIKDAEHRFSRPQDIVRLMDAVAQFTDKPTD